MDKTADSEKNATEMDMKVKLSTLWIVVMFSMIFADILSFMTPEFRTDLVNGTMEVQVTQGLLLIFAILLEIPIMMIFLSRMLSYKINRVANIIAAVITIIFVIGGGSMYLHYIFFAGVEVICMLMIIWYSWRWDGSK